MNELDLLEEALWRLNKFKQLMTQTEHDKGREFLSNNKLITKIASRLAEEEQRGEMK